MKAGCLHLALLALLAGCRADGVTQALIQVELSSEQVARLASLEVEARDAADQPLGAPHRFALQGVDGPKSTLSFGALPAAMGQLRLHVRGLGSDGARVLEQEIAARLPAGESTPITLMLRAGCVELSCPFGIACRLSSDPRFTPACLPAQIISPVEPGPEDRDPDDDVPSPCRGGDLGCPQGCAWPLDTDCPRPIGQRCAAAAECATGSCVDGFCCDGPCDVDCGGCGVPGAEGACTRVVSASDPANCGACGAACSLDHVSEPHCSGSVCDGRCEPGWDDCNRDQRADGCETALQTDWQHCGSCERACPYPACAGGECVSFAYGSTTASDQVSLEGNRLYGQRIFVAESRTLAGLGIRLRSMGAGQGVRFRLALYESAEGDLAPGQRIAQTGELSSDTRLWAERGIVSVHGGIEQRVAPVSLRAGAHYWLFYLGAQTASVAGARSPATSLESSGPIAYESAAELPSPLPSLVSRGPNRSWDAYLIAVPSAL